MNNNPGEIYAMIDNGESAPVQVYTDGACSGNPGPGGWAWAIDGGPQTSGGDPDTTNQRMELMAVLDALRTLEGAVDVYSDSTYVVNCYNDRWFDGWLKRNWRNSQKKPVANRDLWEPLVEIFQARSHELRFFWVKGHSGDRMNDLVDALAVSEVDKLRPDPSSTAGTVEGPVVPWPVERAVVVYGADQVDAEVRDVLQETIDQLDSGFDIVVSGLRRGTELIAAEMAVKGNVPLGVVLPFADPAERWPSSTKTRFEACVEAAEWVVTLEGSKAKPGAAVKARDQWMRSAVVGAIVADDAALVDELDGEGLGVIEVVAE